MKKQWRQAFVGKAGHLSVCTISTTSCFISCSPVGRLIPEDLVTVLTELYEVRAVWYNFGLALNLTSDDLDAIKGPYTDPSECLREAINGWLNTFPDPSWESVVQALRSPIVGRKILARRLEQKYCIQELNVPPAGKNKHEALFTELMKNTIKGL